MNILEELKLSKKQNDNKRYEYLCQQFNAVDYAIKLEKYTIKLQQENKQLKMIVNEYERLNKGFKITNVQEYNIYELLSYKKYKDNWNKLKNIIKDMASVGYIDKREGEYWATGWNSEYGVRAKILLSKMQELESDSNE